MTSRSFDRAVDYYDSTRELPEPIATGGIDAIFRLAQTRPGAMILEAGAGTGRIGLPLLQRGASWFGCDLSCKMLARLRAKEAAARVAQADVERLPFEHAQFDAVITIHVMHLVAGWRQALREFQRVLRPGGVYINSWHWRGEESVERVLRDYWRGRVVAHGGEWRRPGIQSREELNEEARRLGAAVEEVEAARYFSELAPQAVIENVASRVFSDAWDIPGPIFERSLADLRIWARQAYPDLDRPRRVEQRFLLDVIRFG
jgi:ubiquinone/menaquinone biosynthesis C-methylase UbiE